MWTIDKEFNFEMGHRVWSQKLAHAHLSLGTECACKHLHGHSYKLKVFLKSNKLDQSGMVTDFKNLNYVKLYLDNNLDHKFMIDVHDPNFCQITSLSIDQQEIVQNQFDRYIRDYDYVLFPIKHISTFTDEHLDSFVCVNFVPTSENICKFLHAEITDMVKDVAVVSAIELWETAKSHCRYEA